MDKLVQWINNFAEAYLTPEEKAPKGRPRLWQPIFREELYAYFGVLIHMGISTESSIEDYWGSLETHGSEYIVKKYISLVRFQQIDRYF